MSLASRERSRIACVSSGVGRFINRFELAHGINRLFKYQGSTMSKFHHNLSVWSPKRRGQPPVRQPPHPRLHSCVRRQPDDLCQFSISSTWRVMSRWGSVKESMTTHPQRRLKGHGFRGVDLLEGKVLYLPGHGSRHVHGLLYAYQQGQKASRSTLVVSSHGCFYTIRIIVTPLDIWSRPKNDSLSDIGHAEPMVADGPSKTLLAEVAQGSKA